MSIRLMTEAWKSNVPAGTKIVLLALCDNSNDQGECYPSISMLAEKCSMSERSVFNHITELEKIGAVVRKNRSGRSTVYMLDPCKFCTPENSAPLQRLHPTPAKSAPPPLQPFHPTPATVAPITINEPSIEPSSNHKYSSAIAKPECVAQSVWADFQQLRKAKRAPITATALDGIKREAEKAGISLSDALAICCERGWTGFKADWLENAQQPKRTVQAESFAERDARVKANRMAEFAPNVAARHSTVIETFDLEANHVAIASH